MSVCVCVCVRDGFADLGFYHPAEPAAFCRGALAAGTRGDAKGKRRALQPGSPRLFGAERGRDGACARGDRAARVARRARKRRETRGLSRVRPAGGARTPPPGRAEPPESPSLFCLPPQTMDPHGGRRLGARLPAEEPSPPAC